MKNLIITSLSLVIIIISMCGCEIADIFKNDHIVYQSVNKEFVLSRDIRSMQDSNGEVLNHTDSILTGLIDAEFISTGQKQFDLNGDLVLDIGFEIIDLHKFNINRIPDHLDSLAARVIPISVELLDNSTYGYVDAMDLNDVINKNGNWSTMTSVLGTFGNAGRFQGNGDKYLGIRFPEGENYIYGWIQVYCSQHSDTLRIIDYAFNKTKNSSLLAGQVK
jgi:hypothetical protein